MGIEHCHPFVSKEGSDTQKIDGTIKCITVDIKILRFITVTYSTVKMDRLYKHLS